MGKKAGRTPPTIADVRERGLETATLGRGISQCLSVKGHCVIDAHVDEDHLDNVLGDISAVEEQGRFASVPAAVLEGLLGKEGSARVADVGVAPEDAMVSIHTDSFVRDGAALRHFDAELTRYASLLSPFLMKAKLPVTSRSSGLIHEAAKPKSEGPALTEEACSKWLKLFSSHRFICIWCLGPESGELELKPWDTDSAPLKVTMRPGRLVIARAELLRHNFSSAGLAYCLTCFFLAGDPSCEQEPVSPCANALHHWAEERRKKFKEASVQEQRYMDMPREWEEKANREVVNTQRIAIRAASVKQVGTEDPLSWVFAFSSCIDYATQVPMMRWQFENTYMDDPKAFQEGKTNCMHGAFIEGVELFDNAAFRISRAEASGMDPGHRLTLETGYEALVRDGYKGNTLMNTRGGVYVANPPPSEWGLTPKEIVGGGVCGGGGSIACGRFSFVHGLKGPCISVDVEGASSLVAVNYACSNLSRTGSWEPIPFGICNSWNLQLSVMPFIHLSASGFLSPKGRTFTFDASASGYIRGDCVTSIVLKAMSEMVDGQQVVKDDGGVVLGELAGSATNQSGRRSALSAPDCMALQEVVHEAVRQAQISSLDVDAVESFADAKILDDALEATAMARAYRPQGTLNVDTAAPVVLMSAKSSVGNQVEAMGLSQILKIVLGARVATFHPTPHLRIINPHIDIELCERNAILPTESVDFRLQTAFTGLTNRSIAGTNCHAILFAKAPEEIFRPRQPAGPSQEPIRPILWWPQGGGELGDDMVARAGYYVMGTFNRWRPERMEAESPDVFGFTLMLSENRCESFQIALDGDPSRVLHPVLPQAGKASPVTGPEAALRLLSWQIDGRPKEKGPEDQAALPKSETKTSTVMASQAVQAIIPDDVDTVDENLAEVGDRFRIRLHIQGRWRMVDWEKLPKAPYEDTEVARTARAALIGDYQVVGSWSQFARQAMTPDRQARHIHRVEVLMPVDGQQHFHLLRNSDWSQVICPPENASMPSKARLRCLEHSPVYCWTFNASAGDVFCIEFQRVSEDGVDKMKVSWDKVSSGTSVPEELKLLHSRRRYMVRLCFEEWLDQLQTMHWTGQYYQLFVELNASAKASFLILEEGNLSRCLHPASKDAHLHQAHELQGPERAPADSAGLHWTLGAAEEDKARPGSRYEIRLHLDEEGETPMRVDWVPVSAVNVLEEAAHRGFFVAWLPVPAVEI